MKAGLVATAATSLALLVPAGAGAEVVTPKVVTPQVITPSVSTPTVTLPTVTPPQVNPPAVPITLSPAAPPSSPAPSAPESHSPSPRNSTSIDDPDADEREFWDRRDANLTMGYYENVLKPAFQFFDTENFLPGRTDLPVLAAAKVLFAKVLVEAEIKEIQEMKCDCSLAAGDDPEGGAAGARLPDDEPEKEEE